MLSVAWNDFIALLSFLIFCFKKLFFIPLQNGGSPAEKV
jgi:hypothetical protein